MVVTNGLGFYPETKQYSISKDQEIIIDYALRENGAEEDSIESLRSHLAEMDLKTNPSLALERIVRQERPRK